MGKHIHIPEQKLKPILYLVSLSYRATIQTKDLDATQNSESQ